MRPDKRSSWRHVNRTMHDRCLYAAIHRKDQLDEKELLTLNIVAVCSVTGEHAHRKDFDQANDILRRLDQAEGETA